MANHANSSNRFRGFGIPTGGIPNAATTSAAHGSASAPTNRVSSDFGPPQSANAFPSANYALTTNAPFASTISGPPNTQSTTSAMTGSTPSTFRFLTGGNNGGAAMTGGFGGRFGSSSAGNHVSTTATGSTVGLFGTEPTAAARSTGSLFTGGSYGSSATTKSASMPPCLISLVDTPASHKDIRIPKKQAIRFGPSFLVIHVGEGEAKQSFAVHEALICARSKFFEKAMNGKWQEAENKVVNLPEDDPIAFGLYKQLLYTRRLPSKLEAREGSIHEGPGKEYVTLSRLYVLAEKIQDREAKRAAMDALLSRAREVQINEKNWWPGPEAIAIIYSGTVGPCAARRLMVDFYTCKATGSWLDQAKGLFPAKFLYDLAISLLDKRPCPTDTILTCDSSEYHDKEDGVKEEEPSD